MARTRIEPPTHYRVVRPFGSYAAGDVLAVEDLAFGKAAQLAEQRRLEPAPPPREKPTPSGARKRSDKRA